MQIIKRILICAVACCLMWTIAQPALATKAVGKSSHGYYWLLTDNDRWQCRSTTDSRIQSHQKCIEAGAVKPK
ncbi:hypothetical protein [Spirulina sp.]|uniref:hypothetical protein n=1 Tax=Spirulina sp. TaxID=1157 RepID=UPI003F7244D8